MGHSQPSLGCPDLVFFMQEHRISGELIRCSEPTPTVKAAADVMGVVPEQIVKSILFLISGKPVLVIACGEGMIDRKPISDHFGVGRKQVKLAGADIVLAVTGYPAGTVPPFGHRLTLPTLLDRRVLDQAVIYAGGGEENALVRLVPREILQATGAEIIQL
jgi:prolyl-tRNA editing enzyme YbaK/EbsC (Cys-tRNA(Pro) deacylase)